MAIQSCLALLAVAFYCHTFSTTQAVPLRPLINNGRMYFSRDQVSPFRTYPHRTMMFTGYYRPSSGSRATNVYAQGNAISGGTYLTRMGPEHWPTDVGEGERTRPATSAEALPDYEGNDEYGNRFDSDDGNIDQKTHKEEPPVLHTTETIATERDQTSPPLKRKTNPKKKKTPVFIDQDDDEEEEEEDYGDLPMSFVPSRGNKRSRGFLPFNTYFPMIFSFPRTSSRSKTSGSVPGTITAIANSYSTARGGVASSVATAYGGTPNGKRQRQIGSSSQQ